MSPATLEARAEAETPGALQPSPELARKIAQLPPAQRARLVEMLRRRRRESEPLPTSIPLSPIQWAMWLTREMAPESPAYNVGFEVWVRERLDPEVLEEVARLLVTRHACLRTTYALVDGEPMQTVHDEMGVDLEHVEMPGAERSELEARAKQIYERPYDLENGPLLRLGLVSRGEREHLLLIGAHHVTVDLWSIGLLLDEISRLYPRVARGEKPEPAPVELDFRRALIDQRERLEAEEERHWAYWREALGGELPRLELPTDRPRGTVQALAGGTHVFSLGRRLSGRLRELARREGKTLYTVLLAGYQALLHRLTGQSDLLTGSPVAGRSRRELEGVVGCLINFVVIRGDLAGDPSFRTLLDRLSERVLGALEHQELPFRRLTERLGVRYDAGRPLMTEAGFSLDRAPEPAGQDLGSEREALRFEPIAFLDQQEGQFDLYLEMIEIDGELWAGLRYSSDLFDAATARRFARELEAILEGAAADPERRLSELPLAAATRQAQLVEWNGTHAELPLDVCFHEIFEAQARRLGERTAATFGDQEISYRRLNARANRLARVLVDHGVGSRNDVGGEETVVALLAHRDLDFLTAVIAIFKAGGAYLPLDPGQPPARHAQILEQSRARFLLVHGELDDDAREAQRALPAGRRPVVLPFAELWTEDRSEQDLPSRATPDSLAYVLFTSGSTGRPKGAMIRHRGMLNHLFAKVADLGLDGGDVVCQNASQCFDISVWQMLAALVVEGRVAIVDDATAHDPARLLEAVERQGVSVLETVPSLLRLQLEEVEARSSVPHLERLRWLVPTGEALPPELARRWLERYPEVPLLNAYGPTECSDDVTHEKITAPPAEEVQRVAIGRPVLNTRLYVLDRHGRPLPIGAVGELHVAGEGVGRGYLHDPRKTAVTFVPDPFAPRPGERLYRTGDLGRWLGDGRLDFLGRRDHQVKVRGVRLELGEIEAAVRRAPGVEAAAVLARDGGAGHKQLVAFVVLAAERALDVAELRRAVREHLPESMVPSAFVAIEAMPLSRSGKADRKALERLEVPEAGTGAATGAATESEPSPGRRPRTTLERRLAAVWGEVLGREEVSADDSFFELGGDSVQAIRIAARLERLGCRVLSSDLFHHETIARLAAHLEGRSEAAASAELDTEPSTEPSTGPSTGPGIDGARLEALRRSLANQIEGVESGEAEIEDAYELTPLQEGILFHALEAPETGVYFLQFQATLDGTLDHGAWLRAWRRVLRRHPALRTSFHLGEDARPVQVVRTDAEAEQRLFDLRELAEADRQAWLEGFLEADRRRGFELERAPLLRVTLARTGDAEHRLVVSFHHLVLDGWSLARVLGEALRGYRALTAGEAAAELELEPAPAFREHVEWLRRRDRRAAERFWRHALDGLPEVAPLGRSESRAESRESGEHRQRRRHLDAGLAARLGEIAREHRLTLNTLLRGAWALRVAELTGSDDVVFGATVAGRADVHPGAGEMVGLLINTVPVRARLAGGRSALDLLAELQRFELESRRHEHTPLAEIRRWLELGAERPLFESNFVYESYPLGDLLEAREGELGLRDAEVLERGSFPLTLLVVPGERPLVGIDYDPARFDDTEAAEVLDGYRALLERFADRPDATLDELVARGDAEPRLRAESRTDAGTDTASTTRGEAPGREPRSELERLLTELWAEVLGRERVGVDDGFFELGGDSIQAIRLVTRIRRALKAQMAVRDLLETQTVAACAHRLAERAGDPARLEAVARARRRLASLSGTERQRLLEKRRRPETTTAPTA